MDNQRRTFVIITITFLAVQSLTAFGIYKNKQFEFLYDTFFVTIAFIIWTVLEVIFKLYIDTYLKVILMLAAIAHCFIGEYLNLYVTSYWFDKFLHVFGTYAFTLFTYSLLNIRFLKPSLVKSNRFMLIVLLGISIGAYFEILEFFSDIILKPKVRYQTDLIDTNLDMVFDTAGSIMAAFHLTASDKKLIKK